MDSFGEEINKMKYQFKKGNQLRKGLKPGNVIKKGEHLSVKTEFKKGQPGFCYWTGKKRSEETKEKMRKSKLGRKLSADIVSKISRENHYNWKGGITKVNKAIRSSYKYRQWRDDVFTKDEWICQKCGLKGVYFEPHHINPLYKLISEFNIKTLDDALLCSEIWNINNGITLCSKCHSETDSYRGKCNKKLN